MKSLATHQGILERTEKHVKEKLSDDCSGHDWYHVQRVHHVAVHLAKAEGADLFVVELAALLHDIADWKFHGGDDSAGPRAARHWLESQQVEAKTIDHVSDIIAGMSFKGAGVTSAINTLEGRIVQDADRLDAIGAIGIARSFAYGGHKGQPIYDPQVATLLHDSFESYKDSPGTTINHFHEKLLLLKDRMNTEPARQIAQKRHALMEEFLFQFHQEWNSYDVANLESTDNTSTSHQQRPNITKR